MTFKVWFFWSTKSWLLLLLLASASQSSNVGVGGVFFNSCFFPFKPQSIIFYNRLYLSWESSAFCASLNDAIQTFFSEWQKVKSPPVDITLFKMLFVVVWCSNIFLFIFELFFFLMPENVQSIMASVWLLVKFFFSIEGILLCIFPIQGTFLENFCGVFHNAKISAWKDNLYCNVQALLFSSCLHWS